MAYFIDERQDELQLEEGSELVDISEQYTNTLAEESNVEKEPEATKQEDDELPEKYRGKSAKEIAKMHMEAEKMIGKHSSEVGELRSVVDDFIKTQLSTKKTTTEESQLGVVDDVDFYVDPRKAVEKAVNDHPAVRQAQELAQKTKQQEIIQKLQQSHPDYMQIVQDSDFLSWVKASLIRTKLLVEADQNYDFDSANELLSLYKERQELVTKTKEIAEQDRKSSVKSASSPSPKGSGEGMSKKIYRRADIIRLAQFQPDKYEALYEDIQRAYAENRVR